MKGVEEMGVGEWGGQLRCWTQGGAEVMGYGAVPQERHLKG